MRCFVKTVLFVLLICGACVAEPHRTVEEMPVIEYREWLGEKESLWDRELDNLKVFAPEKVQQLEKTREQIQKKAAQLGTASNEVQAKTLKADTQNLVYALEKSLESLYGQLEQQSGPVLVLDL